ncbi:hypothetical protein [Bradyrhizobium sp. dw_78]|uniref:hypothetical protein n=1 Tax=Bradyrhizobium sp. dw_78 TaxID=2719793 RepID=UPI001BD1CECE|nr:hypothetical protein [Bradyrhizobium sp. dw_78]
MHKLFFAAFLLSATISTANAQHSGTDKEQEACTHDVEHFCRKLMDQGDFAILACLKQNRPKLRAACRQVLVSHGQ